MIIDYSVFFRRFGVRQVQQLLTPRTAHIESFQLPRGAVLHYAHGDPTKYGPVESDLAFRGLITEVQTNGDLKAKSVSRPIWLQHMLSITDPIGSPIKLNVQPLVLVRQFQQHHRRFRLTRQPQQALTDVNSMMVYNYDMLNHLWRYPRTPFNAYFEWYNIEKEVWRNVAEVVNTTDRPQFIIRSMPKLLPAQSSFQMAEKMTTPSRRILQVFNTPEHLFLLELWKWFGPNRAKSMLSVIPRDKLSRINIIFQESGHWLVINLGLLDSWRKPLESELLPNEKVKGNLINPVRYQARSLRFFMSILQLRSLVSPDVTAIVDQVLDKDDLHEAIKEYSEQSKLEVHRVPSGPAKKDPVTGKTELNSVLQRAAVMDAPDEPEDTPDTVKEDEAVEAQIDADLNAMEKISAARISAEPDPVPTPNNPDPQPTHAEPIVLKRLPLDEAVMAICDRHADEGLMSAAQYRHYQKISSAYKTMKAPDGISTMEQFVNIAPETLKIKSSKVLPDIKTVPDKTMLKSSLLEFDERYISEVMQRDIASSVLAIQNAGVAVTNYDVEKVETVLGAYNIYTVRVTPVEGASSTLRFKLPVVEEDGSYMANGVKYRMRKQRGDVPIRKTGPGTVTMTSYYGKTFIRRSEKKVNDYGNWINNAIMAKNLNELDSIVSIGHPNNVFDHLFKAPRLYSIIASSFRSFVFHPVGMPADLEKLQFEMSFDHTKREELYGAETLAAYERDGGIVAGRGLVDSDYFIVINKDSSLSIAHNNALTPLPPIETLLGLDRNRAPVDFAVIKISGENIPLGIVLAYEIGLDNLIALLKANVRRVPAGRRVNLLPHEDAIYFNDETLVIDRNDKLACMFLAGFNEYHRAIKRYNIHLFNSRDVYLNVLEGAGLGARWLREIDLFYQMFIDPITHDLLVEMREPTDMRLLLLRAGSMLLHDDHPAEFDAAWMRIKGYERMAGAVYSEIVSCLRKHNGAPGKHRSQLDMHPYDIWTAIQTDPSKAMVSDINPIQNLREKEAVTYNGTGGRNSRTMTKHTREYHENDKGTISSDTVDSGDVAINTYTSADPQFTSLRGLSRRYEKSMGTTPLLSSAALISVGATHDDPKRVNFIGIQQSHGVSCIGYRQMPVRTGYEQVIAQRTSDMYAAAAKEDGKVISVTSTGVIVQYADGKKQGYEIGRRFGNAAGLVIPHSVVSNVKVGQEFKRGHILTYNDNFFEKDILNPTNVVWKAGTLAKVALMEVSETLEDSSAISQRLADRLTTAVSKTIDVVVNFTQSVRKLVKAGDHVNSEDILCIIEDSVTSNAGLFDDESLETLRLVENQSPQAKVKGVVERVEVYYHGDKEDMSDSLRAIANVGDKQLMDRLKSIGRQPLTGSVDEGFRIDGDPLPLDTMAIRVYITSQLTAGEGDKGVFANQMKTVFGKKFVGEYVTESGEHIDAIFGQKSIDDRIVHSPIMIGTTNVLLRVIGKKAYEAYNS